MIFGQMPWGCPRGEGMVTLGIDRDIGEGSIKDLLS